MDRRLGALLAAGLLLAGAAGDLRAVQARAGSPIRVDGAYTLDVMANVRGGVRTGAVGLGNLDLTGRLDLERLLGWSGTTVFVYGLATHGARPTDLTGDAQVASNIEAPDGVRLYEAWVEKNFRGPDLSFLVGLYDVNSEFDVTEEALLFLNSSFGIGAEFGNSGVNGPSIFPVTSLGARVQWHPSHQLYLQGAVLDGVPGDPDDPGSTAVHLSSRDGVLWTAEIGFLKHAEPPTRRRDPELGRSHVHTGIPWRVAAGVWQFTRRSEGLGGGGRGTGHPGVYLLGELRPRIGPRGTSRPLGLFVRVGVADGRTNRFDAYTGAGLTYRGLLPGRDADAAGLGVAIGHNGEDFERTLRRRGEPVSGTETAVELTYRVRAGSHLEIQPDLQWIIDPGTDPRRESALLLGLRLTASL